MKKIDWTKYEDTTSTGTDRKTGKTSTDRMVTALEGITDAVNRNTAAIGQNSAYVRQLGRSLSTMGDSIDCDLEELTDSIDYIGDALDGTHCKNCDARLQCDVVQSATGAASMSRSQTAEMLSIVANDVLPALTGKKYVVTYNEDTGVSGVAEDPEDQLVDADTEFRNVGEYSSMRVRSKLFTDWGMVRFYAGTTGDGANTEYIPEEYRTSVIEIENTDVGDPDVRIETDGTSVRITFCGDQCGQLVDGLRFMADCLEEDKHGRPAPVPCDD